ncbi:hypothetical protein EA462_06475 [Natrarchaeobius halalkaliphilus]|uniref:NRDE family protein n=1 Tax=Natrarchaeobius halalkaliphilus TaxID=1679091 RepID=A0A3N6P2C6_9EURY|nr:NRDE family protein [Natrarchaeobius halalkaliphilus]RQG91729.1 hypothetical protein EA462_06475 [Natrarchaeobius halalkaliphilus]
MCTLTLAWQVFEDAPVAVAANRDEALERDSLPPAVYRTDPLVVAPTDAAAGGTWIGYNEFGVFAGITNGWTDADLAGERSRGLLVADVLEAESVLAANAVLSDAVAADEYDAFNLVIADAEDAVCYRWDGHLDRTAFDPGVHVVVNAAVDDEVVVPPSRPDAAREQARNARRVRRALSVDTTDPGEPVEAWLERAGSVLADHEYGVCLHEDGFGTRSSSLIALGGTSTYRFAPGPPCRTSYEGVRSPTDSAGSDADGDVEGHI